MFDKIFKKKKQIDDTITTESIIYSIECRRSHIAELLAESSERRDEAIKTLALFPLNYPVDEMELSLSCDINWTLFLTIINRLIKDGEWEFVDEANRYGKGRRIQRVR